MFILAKPSILFVFSYDQDNFSKDYKDMYTKIDCIYNIKHVNIIIHEHGLQEVYPRNYTNIETIERDLMHISPIHEDTLSDLNLIV